MEQGGIGRARRRVLVAVVAVALAAGGQLALAGSASAGCGLYGCPPPSGGGSSTSAPSPTTSSPTQVATYSAPSSPSSPPMSCSVYANGAGMGSYCVSGGGATAQSLRERFGKQAFQRCRYREVPKTIPTPFNSRPDDGRYMMMTCIDNVDFDTYSGGPDRTLDVQVVWVPYGTDVSDHHNGITDFLWNIMAADGAEMPVPFLRTRPNITPVVGYPTFFTFRWLDPSTRKVVAEGPFAGHADGGPFKQITTGGLVIRAVGKKITIDPHQRGIKSTTCAADAPYTEGAPPSRQPADACKITFPRSSASARRYATDEIPSNVHDAFYASVEVDWRVSYGSAGSLQELGNGFNMKIRQVVPVQEVQTPNQPPTAIY